MITWQDNRATKETVSDPWSSKGLCNVKTKLPIENLLKFIGWSTKVVPELKDGYMSRGKISKTAASKFGLPFGIPVSVGWSDATSGMVALDVMSEPSSFVITGTSAIVGSSSRTSPRDGGSLYVIPSTCAPLTVTYGPTQSSGSAIAWIGELLDLSKDQVIDLACQSTHRDLPVCLP